MLILKTVFFLTCISFRKFSEAEPLKGGTDVLDDTTYRFMVSLRSKNSNPPKHYCGGAIIDRRFILTSAQCITGKIPVQSTIVVVRTIETEAVIDANKYDIETAVALKKDTEQRGFDIGLIIVTREIKFSETASFIPLDLMNIVAAGDILTVVAFGNTGHRCEEESRFLQKLDLKVDRISRNILELKTTKNDVAAADAPGICEGDSGSPIIKIGADGEATLVGVVVEAKYGTMYGSSINKYIKNLYQLANKFMTVKEREESELTPNLFSNIGINVID